MNSGKHLKLLDFESAQFGAASIFTLVLRNRFVNTLKECFSTSF